MIRVSKKKKAPKTLSDGVGLVLGFEAELHRAPATAGSITAPFHFPSKIYGSTPVKKSLKAAQHSKCCYCEGEIGAHSPGDVEHFRPKTRSQQEPKGQRLYPGYYWLAFTWANLYLACDLCNRVGKRDLFPLADNGVRARRSQDLLNLELPLILDPGGSEDPRNHIGFTDNVPRALTDLGRHTITILGLDRIELNSRRLKHFRRLVALRRVVLAFEGSAMTPDQAAALRDAQAELQQATEPTAEYSAMAQDLLAT
ncbi:MAG TPA: hypothetical protein VK629_18755 [Steroidobacteraceae bacterium]|nr:hypothetical protein [Steroidobacteraceae bacterium]